MALGVKVTAIISATLVIYRRDLIAVFNEALRNELATHILAIPFLFVYLVYRKRKMLRTVVSLDINPRKELISINEIVGSLLFLSSLFIYWYGSNTFYPLEYHLISLPLFIASCTLIIFNAKTLKTLVFPIAFLILLTPPPSEIAYRAGAAAATLNSEISYSILKTIGLPVSQITEYGAPTLVVTGPSGSSISFVIGIASSGIYSLIGFSIFATFFAYIARGPAWKKATLFLVSLPLIYALNIMRIIILVSIGYWQGVSVAWDVFHLFGGWVLIFLGSVILLFISEKIWKLQIFTTKPKAASCTTCSESLEKIKNFCSACGKLLKNIPVNISKRDLGKIAALLISVILIITISVPVFALTEGPAEVLIQSTGGEQATTPQILPQISDYTLRFVYRDETFEEIAQRDRALVYAYSPVDKSAKTIWVAIEIGSSRATWHSWEACVITWRQTHGRPPIATELDLRDTQLLENPPIKARYFAFQDIRSNITQVILYWYENAIFDTDSSTEQKYVKISLIAYPENPESVPEIEDLLLPFGKAVVNYWEPIKIWSWIALSMAQHALTFLIITIFFLVLILTAYALGKWRERRLNLKLYNRLTSQEEKLILKAVHQAAEKGKATGNNIASTYHSLADKPIKTKTLLETLQYAEQAGLVKRDIANEQDNPLLIWKTQISFSKL